MVSQGRTFSIYSRAFLRFCLCVIDSIDLWQRKYIDRWSLSSPVCFPSCICCSCMSICRFHIRACDKAEIPDYVPAGRLSKATLLAQQKSNEAKTRNILQLTYGRVPEWRPFNFRKNVLVYDIHEQLRTLLVEIRDSVLMLSGETDSDKVTVDLVYCYPDDTYSGRLPEPSLHYGNEEPENAWRLITSGDASCINYTLHDFLRSNESFFFRLDQENFVFINDKKTVSRYYIPSGKDQEYDGVGSIVGMTINIKNDAPESVLVKAMLTITTYGWNLLDKKSLIKEAEYREIFKQNVLNGHKSLLESELAQMYIRHAIKDGNMCPYTGAQCKRPNKTSDVNVAIDDTMHECTYRPCMAAECPHCPITQQP